MMTNVLETGSLYHKDSLSNTIRNLSQQRRALRRKMESGIADESQWPQIVDEILKIDNTKSFLKELRDAL